MAVDAIEGPVKRGEYVPTADRRVVLYGKSWTEFEAMVALRGERRNPRLAYLDGALELMSPSYDHEGISRLLGYLVNHYCLKRGIPVSPRGNWLLEAETDEAGLEPDECFIFASQHSKHDRPDLCIEVIWTSGGLDKLEAYKRLQISEVWFWKDESISVHVLTPMGYEMRERSACLPELDLVVLARFSFAKTLNEIYAEFDAVHGF